MPVRKKPGHYFSRENEWDKIGRYITDEGDVSQIVYISGDGGVGKTAFLTLLYDEYSDQDEPYIIINPVDFDDLTLRMPDNFIFYIDPEQQDIGDE